MDLICYLHPGWAPRIRPASSRRDWMDASPESFAYRCLPLSIANSHGWEILNPRGCDVVWNGGPSVEDVVVRPDGGGRAEDAAVSLFGMGTVTFHVAGIFRTPPGWNLWAGGPPNGAKDGVAALSGVIETDWSPFTFTMNWKLTRPNHPVRFELDEPICFIFPVERRVIDSVTPIFAPISDDPELKAQFEAWSRSRDAFQAKMRSHPPSKPSEKWQKFYHRGVDTSGRCPISDHQAKLHVAPFAKRELIKGEATQSRRAGFPGDAASAHDAPAFGPRSPAVEAPSFAERKYEWILDVLSSHRTLSPAASGVVRGEGVTSGDFLDHYYAANRPIVLGGEISRWPAFKLWNADYLRGKVGARPVEVQADRTSDPDYERKKDSHRRVMPFDAFIDRITGDGAVNDTYLTAYNSAKNVEALAPLREDLGVLEKFLSHHEGDAEGMLWIGPAGTFTPLHHDLTNNLLVQIVGRKRVILAASTSTPNLYNDCHVFSQVSDVADPNIDLEKFCKLKDVRFFDFVLNAGDALFIPICWWHQVTALDFSVSATYTNFLWPNNGFETHPKEN
jgi:hypothetical protein